MNDFKVPVVNWSHGVLQSEQTNRLRCEMLSDVQNPRNIIAILASSQSENAYLSKRDESIFCNNFIIIRNKKTNSTRVYGTDNFLMLPYCSNAESKTNSKVKTEEKDVIMNASLSLNKVMGSKRNKRRITEIEKGNVHIDDVEKKLKKAIKDNELVVKENDETVSTVQETFLPPCHRTATSIEEVYKIDELISTDLLNSLEDFSMEILQRDTAALSKDKRLSEFFLKAFAQTSKKNLLKVKMLLFVDTLLKYLTAPFHMLRKKQPVFCEYSPALNKKILSDFCVTQIDGKLTRPPSMRDKVLCYVLVFLLLINDFSIDMSLLSGHISAVEYHQKLSKLLRAVGAKPEKNSSINYCLKFPLAELSLSNRKSGSFRGKKK